MPADPTDLARDTRRLADDLPPAVVDAIGVIAHDLLGRARAAAKTKQQRLAAKGLKLDTGTSPTLTVSSSTFRGTDRYTDIFFGAELGGQGRPTTRQFPPYRGERGYFVRPTLKAQDARYRDMIEDAVRDVSKKWERHG